MQLPTFDGDVTAEELETHLEFAKEQSIRAGKAILNGFRTRREFVDKSDGSDFDPVTASDREGEQLIRAAVTATWPDQGMLVEEVGYTQAKATVLWPLAPWHYINRC